MLCSDDFHGIACTLELDAKNSCEGIGKIPVPGSQNSFSDGHVFFIFFLMNVMGLLWVVTQVFPYLSMVK